MPRSRLDQSFSLSLQLALRIRAVVLHQTFRQRLNHVWQSLTSLCFIRTPSLQYRRMDWELDPDLPPHEIWCEYLEDPTVLEACAHHLDRCFQNPPANHHGN